MEQGPGQSADFHQMPLEDLAALVLRKEQYALRPAAMQVLADRIVQQPHRLSDLETALRDLEPSTRRRAIQTVAKCGETVRPLVPQLCEIVRSDRIWTVREAAVQAVIALCWPSLDREPDSAVPLHLLECALTDRELLVRAAATQGLAACLRDEKEPPAVKRSVWEGLCAGMEHPHASRRCRAVTALVSLADLHPQAFPLIVSGLRDSHWKVRRTTVQQLAEHSPLLFSPEGRRSVLPELIKRLFDQHSIVHTAAGNALVQIAASSPPESIAQALRLIGQSPSAMENLRLAVKSRELPVQVQEEFRELCHRRIEWHMRESNLSGDPIRGDNANGETAAEMILDIAEQWMAPPKLLAQNPEAARTSAREKEAAWLLTRLVEIHLATEPENPPHG